MLRMLMFLAAVSYATAGIATAEPYWVAYEGNDYPENEGWYHSWGDPSGEFNGPGADRTIADGVLSIDSLSDQSIYDFSRLDLPGQFDPGVGEVFVVEWRLKVDDVVGTWYDPSVGFGSDDAWQVAFGFYVDRIESSLEDDVTIPIAPGVFHEYRCLSSDMRTYDLYIDGELAHQGTFWQGIMESYIGWGDVVSGAASLSHWDYIRFGIVPEPSSLFALMGLCTCAVRRRR